MLAGRRALENLEQNPFEKRHSQPTWGRSQHPEVPSRLLRGELAEIFRYISLSYEFYRFKTMPKAISGQIVIKAREQGRKALRIRYFLQSGAAEAR